MTYWRNSWVVFEQLIKYTGSLTNAVMLRSMSLIKKLGGAQQEP